MQNSMLQWFSQRFLDKSLQPRELLTARKFLYVGLILVLFTVAFFWRRYQVEARAQELAILEQSLGDVELSGRLVRLSLTGSRGVATCVLWSSAIEKQKKNQWNELEFVVDNLTQLQPHFLTPWLFQSWNLSYNVVAFIDRVPDKYFYISRGINLMWRGERQNLNQPDLRSAIGFYTQHRIGQHDQKNTLRSLMSLSLIPLSERKPERFYTVQDDGSKAFNWQEFEKFCARNPQLVRRLREGVRMMTKEEQEQLFLCKTAEEVVGFLAENVEIPALYTRGRDGTDELRPVAERFPALPPERTPPTPQVLYNPPGFRQLTDKSPLDDSTDCYAISSVWFGYAQEPLPDPGVIPGSEKEIEGKYRSVQRRARYMMTILFRSQPCLATAMMPQRLQEEGWYDEEPWKIRDWFSKNGNFFSDNKTVAAVGPLPNKGSPYQVPDKLDRAKTPDDPDPGISGQAWYRASQMFQELGRQNHVLLNPDELDRHKRDADFMRMYESTRHVSNFAHHLNRSQVEYRIRTVQARKTFYNADTENMYGSPDEALIQFDLPSGIKAWKELLFANKEFREDEFIQEQTFETQLTYMIVLKKAKSKELKTLREDISLRMAGFAMMGQINQVGLAGALAPVPLIRQKFASNWSEPIPFFLAFAKGPFDVNTLDANGKEVLDAEGKPVPLVPQTVIMNVLNRRGVSVPRQSDEPPQPVEATPSPVSK